MKRRLLCLSLALLLLFSASALADGASSYGGLRAYTGYTTLLGSSDDKIYNVTLAASRLNGYVLEAGATFSFNNVIGPRTEQWGYKVAENGRGARVRGGGTAQTASTIYLAIRDLDCVRVTEKHTYGAKYNQSYVASSDDAILLDYGDDDFRFQYVGSGTSLTIVLYQSGSLLFCEVYEAR